VNTYRVTMEIGYEELKKNGTVAIMKIKVTDTIRATSIPTALEKAVNDNFKVKSYIFGDVVKVERINKVKNEYIRN
jgi:hypothetical protein